MKATRTLFASLRHFGVVVAVSFGLLPLQSASAQTQFPQLRGWGQNDFGELGIGNAYAFAATPQVVDTDADVARIAASLNHVLLLDTSGNVWSWGANAYGQLGYATTQDYAVYP